MMARRLADLGQSGPNRRLTSADGGPPKILKRIPRLTIPPREMETLLVYAGEMAPPENGHDKGLVRIVAINGC